MAIDIEGSTLTYSYERGSYEIRGVQQRHLDAVAKAERVDHLSASGTVQVLTRVYRGSHFDSSGRPARESPGWRDAVRKRISAVDAGGHVVA